MALLLVAGGTVTFFSACTYSKGKSSLRWQPIRGDLIAVAWHSPSDGPDYPTVDYRYTFAGNNYEGTKACFGAASEATCKLGAATAGEKVTVFVNPANPSESVLLPGASDFAKGFLGVGCGLIILGLLIATSFLATSNHSAKATRNNT
jgi:hypothetical protein